MPFLIQSIMWSAMWTLSLMFPGIARERSKSRLVSVGVCVCVCVVVRCGCEVRCAQWDKVREGASEGLQVQSL